VHALPPRAVLGLSLALAASVATAAPTPLPGPRAWTTTAWTSDNGLPENTVHALWQDRDGYLWVGTYGGLVRFDGARFVAIDLGREASPTLGVYALADDGAGGLWVGTAGGGLVHRAADGSVRHLTQAGTAGQLPSDSVRAVARAADGTALAGTDAGLVRLRGGALEAVPAEGEAVSIRALLPDAEGAWVGSAGAGLWRYDGRSLRRDPRLAGDVTALCSDGRGGIFAGLAGGGGGVVHLPRDGPPRRYGRADGLPDPVVKALLRDRSGALWIGTNGGGLARLKEGRVDVPDLGPGLRQGIVQTLLEDREGLLWAGTLVRGLHRLRRAPVLAWTPEHGLPDPFVKGLAAGREGLWVATNGGGLARLRDAGPASSRFEVIDGRHGLASDILMTVFEDSHGRVFAGSYLKGLDRIEGDRVVEHWSTRNGLPNDTVTAIVEAPGGDLWIGTYGGGLARLRPGSSRPEPVPLRDGGNEVVRTLLAAGDVLWIGTNDGLVRLAGDERRRWTTAEGLGSNVVTALHRDADGTLWIGTRGGGLGRLKNGRLQTVRQRDGLHHDTIYAILDDGAGSLWCSSERGLFRAARRSLEAFFAGTATGLRTVALDKGDGLPSPQCSGGFGGAGVRVASGRLYFPTIEGLAAIDPVALPRHLAPPPVVIEELATELEPHRVDAAVRIEPGRERLEIRYTGLALAAPERLRFRYRLVGYDADWVDAGSRRVAYYTRVPPGEYVFEVVAVNEDGVTSPEPATLAIELRPRFFETRAFPWIAGLALVLVAGGGHLLRLRALHARERELQALVAERTESLAEEHRHAVMALSALETAHAELEGAHLELSRTNDALRAADALKTEMLGIAAHDLKNPLTVIRGFGELLEMKTADPVGRDMAARIVRSADTMLGIVTRLLDSAALESGQLAIERERVDLGVVAAQVVDANRSQAERKRQPLEAELAPGVAVSGDAERLAQVVDNLVGNAIKYSPPGAPVRVRLSAHDGHAVLAVEDEGPGFSADERDRLFRRFSRLSAKPTGGESSSGLGLSIVKQLAELHGGSVDARSPGPGQGATFELRLPLA
jgi:signal transduction histidine kinase/ligand-binding sensor domain-containing protein